jgi:hypothetical protein
MDSVKYDFFIEKPYILIKDEIAFLKITNTKVSSAWIKPTIKINEVNKEVFITGKYVFKELSQEIKININGKPSNYKFYWVKDKDKTELEVK